MLFPFISNKNKETVDEIVYTSSELMVYFALHYTNTSNIINPAHAKCLKPESVLNNAFIFQVVS